MPHTKAPWTVHKDTAGRGYEVYGNAPYPFCRCGLTGGCYLCNPTFYPPLHIGRLQDAKLGEKETKKWINDKAKNTPSKEKLRVIREKAGRVWEALNKEEMLVCPTCGTVLGDKKDF